MHLQARTTLSTHSFRSAAAPSRVSLLVPRTAQWASQKGCSSHSRCHLPRASSQEANTASKQRDVASMTIEDLDDDYCNDFECTSSPAVEQTVRALARDISRMKFTTSLLQPDVQYNDGYRSFRGQDKYRREFWCRAGVKEPRARVTRLRMLDNGTAEISWQLKGQVAVWQIDIPVTSTFTLNLVTGRVLTHNETWDLSGLSPPVSAAVTASRMAWSAQQVSKDAGEGINNAMDSLSSMASLDDDDQYYQNPTDPTKFFQNQDNTKNDAINLALLVAGLYLVFRVYSELETLP